MYRYKLTKLTLNDGSQVLPGKLTVFIGPNNVGKSRALKDISLLSTSSQPAGTVVVNEAEWTMPETAQDLFDAYPATEPHHDPQGGWSRFGINYLLRGGSTTGNLGESWRGSYESIIRKANKRAFAASFGSDLIAFLTTEDRFDLVKEVANSDFERQRSSLLQVLYCGGKPLTNRLSRIVKEAFDCDHS